MNKTIMIDNTPGKVSDIQDNQMVDTGRLIPKNHELKAKECISIV